MSPSRWASLVAVCALSCTATVAKGDALFSKVSHYRLANGVEVVLAPETDSPRVVVDLWFRSGAANEEAGQSGWAHLVEHLLLGDTLHISRAEQNAALSAVGADKEAMTRFDNIEAYAIAPANQLETLLWFRSDQVGFAAPQLTNNALRTEQDVVLNELRQREGRPFVRARQRLFGLLFPKPHPYHDYIGGDPADIRRATVDGMRPFMNRHFAPSQVVVVIGGGFQPDEARVLVDKYFGTLPRGEAFAPAHVVEPPLRAGEVRESVVESAAAPRLVFGWMAPAPYSRERLEVDLFEFFLGDAPSSLLKKRLVQELGLADTVSCSLFDAAVGLTFRCEVALRRGVTVDAVMREVDATIAQLRSGPPAAALTRAKVSWRASFLRDIEDVLERTRSLASYYFYTGRTDFADVIAQHETVTVESLQRSATRWLALEHRVVVTAQPGAEQ